jgi:hypothetical protein
MEHKGSFYAVKKPDPVHMGPYVNHGSNARSNSRLVISDVQGGGILVRLVNGGTGAVRKYAKAGEMLSLFYNNAAWTRNGFAAEGNKKKSRRRSPKKRQGRTKSGVFNSFVEVLPDLRALGKQRNLEAARRLKRARVADEEAIRRANASSKYNFR